MIINKSEKFSHSKNKKSKKYFAIRELTRLFRTVFPLQIMERPRQYAPKRISDHKPSALVRLLRGEDSTRRAEPQGNCGDGGGGQGEGNGVKACAQRAIFRPIEIS